MTTTYAQLWRRLTPLYDDGEAKAIVRLVLEERFGFTLTDLYGGRLSELSAAQEQELELLLARLEQAEPVQYVLGGADFCGHRFTVTPDVLIPRPETEELCQWIRADAQPASILDIGTGSGCIAITLALAFPAADVTGWDISVPALAVARGNADRLGARVRWEQVDILSPLAPPVPHDGYSVIVSNPPYIARQEAAVMAHNVLDYEPHTALFVPDDDALLFYRAIGSYAQQALTPGGQLYFEINPLYSDALSTMLRAMGFADVQAKADQFGRQRMMKATKR